MVGLRVRPIPLFTGTAILSGFAGLDPTAGIEGFAQVPFPVYGDIQVGLLPMGSARERAACCEQRYDFGCGELHTRFRFEAIDATVDGTVLTYCSRTAPSIVVQDLSVAVDRDCDLVLKAGIDPTGCAGDWAGRMVTQPGTPAADVDGLLRWYSFGNLAVCGGAYVTQLSGEASAERNFDTSSVAPLATSYRLHARPGRQYRLQLMTSLVPDVVHPTPDLHAVRLLKAALLSGFDHLREENRQAWADLWRARVVLDGAPSRWQAMADAAQYYLHASVHPSSVSSTSLFGLGYWPDYHYYRGHVMWDIETFAVPPLLLTYPDAVRAMLLYRSRSGDAARANARSFGYLGTQYPWESSLTSGHEAAPVDAEAPSIEHHVTMDVALAFARFVHATSDHEFALEHAWPVLRGAAEWIASRVVETERGYEIRRAGGVAETGQPVDNAAFVNMQAIRTLQEAIGLGERLRRQCPAQWDAIAKALVVPHDERGIIVNHDGYHPDEDKGATPDAPAGLFPGDFEADARTEQKTLQYFLALADRYAGAPMLSSMLGVYAARVGDRDRSLELFEKGYAAFIRDPFAITLEMDPAVYPDQPRAGPFTANLGGFLTACIYGLTGMRLGPTSPSSWCRRVVTMPRGWDGIHVERLWVRGQPASLDADHGDERARLVFHETVPDDQR